MIYPLLPFAFLYDAVTAIRNFMYDCGILSSRSYDLPVICVGNLAVGGTGKTPHTEYLIRLLQDKGYKVAVLSRGYKRKTRGYVVATAESTAADVGDEPLQMKRKFPSLMVAVDEDRCDGIDRLMADADTSGVDVILLDDAVQHRRVSPGLTLLLTDSHLTYADDYLMPAGRLRENRRGSKRADIVVVTKLADDVDDNTAMRYAGKLGIGERQTLYFTRYKYGDLYNSAGTIPLSEVGNYNMLVVTGIASPETMERELSRHADISVIRFGDHHDFTHRDYMTIHDAYVSMPDDKPRIVVSTEKDMTRLHLDSFLPHGTLYALPIEVEVVHNSKDMFNQQIIDYVRENSRNSTVSQAPDDRQA